MSGTTESVWDYPRPPRLEAVAGQVRVEFNGVIVAESTASYRVLETSHPPVYYIPQADVRMEYLVRETRNSFCEWKGVATYWTIVVEDRTAKEAAWGYEKPTHAFTAITGYLAFYASRVDACYLDGELVTPQPGSFYGGWITSAIAGPFKS